MQARDYQIEAVNSVWSYFAKKSGNPVIAMPTGTGKSVVIAMFLRSIFMAYPRQRIMCLTHVKELIEQNYLKLLAVWPGAPAGVYSAGLNRRDTLNSIIFAGIASVARRAHEFGFIDLLLIDEAHLVSPFDETMYQLFIAELKKVNPNLKVIGLTATPWRLGHGHITEDGIFTDVCFDITGMQAFIRLIAEGYLAPLIPKNTNTILRTDGVHMRGGEFIQSELQNAVNRDEVTEAALREAIELGYDRHHWLIFASGVEHALNVSAMLNTFGVSCVAIHSKMTDTERDDAIIKFKSGHYRAAVNNNVLTTGFDFPAIDLILCLRPTASSVLWVQMLGRGTRPLFADGFNLDTIEGRLSAIAASQKQNCLVLDFANNTRRLGPINDPVIPKKKGHKAGEAPVKLCDACQTWNHASVRHCSFCGAEFKFQTKLKQGASTADLIKGENPIVEVFKVDHITYTVHTKHDRPPMLCATYYCGLKMFKEFVCLEHEGYAGRKARMWWRERASDAVPATVNDALNLVEGLAVPTHLRVWINKKYPEIMASCFDGTAFGTQEASAGPTVKSYGNQNSFVPEDDDIPF